MKRALIGLLLLTGVSCQIYTKIQEDGYHYDKPNFDLQLNLPNETPKSILPVKPEISLPSLPAFVPQINLPKVIPVKPTSQPLPVKPDVILEVPDLPPVPSFIPQINLPKVIPVKPSNQPLPVKPNAVENVPDLPPVPSFIPQINLPKIIPLKPTSLPVKPDVDEPDFDIRILDDEPRSSLPVKPSLPPLPSFIPQINLPKIIPAKPASLPVKPDVQKPAPFAPRISLKTTNDYLPPLPTNDYLPPVDISNQWVQWKKKFNKRYATDQEDQQRQAIFEDNWNFIDLHNVDFAAGKKTFDCALNKFADLTTEEFILERTGLRLKGRSASQSPSHFYDAPFGSKNVNISAFERFSSQSSSSSSSSSLNSAVENADQGQNNLNIFMPSPLLEKEVKDEVDWRKEGAITPVKNQGKCASCWAFSANGALEAHNFLRKRTGPIPLSEQNLIDCVKENDGCDGGFMTNAYIYAAKNPGVDKEDSYPYEAKQSKCRFNAANVGGDCMTHMEIQIGNEKALEQAVASVGPVAAGIDGAQRSFQFYKSGYYFDPKCDQEVNHAVLIVGYGKAENGEEFWICKNSWDTDWGEEGYIRMAKNKNNHCGITNLASYPIV